VLPVFCKADAGFVLGRKSMAPNACEPNFGVMATRQDEIEGQGKRLAQVPRGWMACHAVPMSGAAILAFWHHMIERRHSALSPCLMALRLDWRLPS